MLIERSRLGDESRDEGFDDKDKEDLGLVGGAAESSGRRRIKHFLWGQGTFWLLSLRISS